jgi:hypothetical protein
MIKVVAQGQGEAFMYLLAKFTEPRQCTDFMLFQTGLLFEFYDLSIGFLQ